jgi:hypothetical protein
MFMPPIISIVPPSDQEDPVPAEVLAVIELFATQLAKVSFPDIDAQTLRRQADDLRAEAKLVAKAREALDAMTATLAGKLSALNDTSARAIAYARIYSDAHPDRPALAAALASLSTLLARPTAALALAPTPKRRGRPPKRAAELFDAPAADEAAAG